MPSPSEGFRSIRAAPDRAAFPARHISGKSWPEVGPRGLAGGDGAGRRSWHPCSWEVMAPRWPLPPRPGYRVGPRGRDGSGWRRGGGGLGSGPGCPGAGGLAGANGELGKFTAMTSAAVDAPRPARARWPGPGGGAGPGGRRGGAGGVVEVAGSSACGVGLPVPLLGITEAGEGLGEGGEGGEAQEEDQGCEGPVPGEVAQGRDGAGGAAELVPGRGRRTRSLGLALSCRAPS